MISTVEATLENPRAILQAQEHVARRDAVAAMKAEGIDYDRRMELLEEVTYPKPLAELLDAAYESYAAELPWARDYELRPKSVVRDMYERAMGFREYVALYQMARSEGVVLRYLSDAYRAIRQTVPESARTEELAAITDWLGELVRQVDSSLLEEWSELSAGDLAGAEATANPDLLPPPPPRLTQQKRAFTVLVRNELFRRIQLADLGRWAELGELDGSAGFDADAWSAAMDEYFALYDTLGVGADARNPALFTAVADGGAVDGAVWRVRQVFDDPAGDRDWGLTATVDLAASDEAGEPVLRLETVGPFPAGWPA